MIAGLPGTGIGGLYYLLLGLWMPFREAIARLSGGSSSAHRSLVVRMIFLTCAIIVGMALTGEFIGWLVAQPVLILTGATAQAATPVGGVKLGVDNYLQFSMFGWAFLVLIGVVSSVQMLRLAVRAVEFVRRGISNRQKEILS